MCANIDIEILPFNLRGAVNDAVRTMQPQASKKELMVTYNVEPEVPKLLMGGIHILFWLFYCYIVVIIIFEQDEMHHAFDKFC